MRLIQRVTPSPPASKASPTSVACLLFSSYVFCLLALLSLSSSVCQASALPPPSTLTTVTTTTTTNMPPHLFQRSIRNEFLHRLKSIFGVADGAPKPVDAAKHTVWLNDNTAWRDPSTGAWRAEFVAAYFARDTGEDASEFVAAISDLIGLADDAAERATVVERVQPFADAILPGYTVDVAFGGTGGGRNALRLGPSNDQGISSNELRIPGAGRSYVGGQVVESRPVNSTSQTGSLKTVFAEPTGWLVVSDVDDTIKVSETYNPGGLIKKTFVDESEPVRGMPELFARLTQTLASPPFFYLTASPYNLYRFLSSFREKFFPLGTMILRDSSWMNIAGFLSTITEGTQNYKVDRLDKIHRWLPRRSTICIGDSTQADPEAYAEAYRRHPEWIKAIYIRKVAGGRSMEAKNKDQRFIDAFKGVPDTVWRTFVEPEELYPLVDGLVA